MKWRVIGLIGALLLAGGVTWWKHHTLKPYRVTVGQTVFIVRLADTPLEQQNGLRGVTQLAQNEGMLFVFPEVGPRVFTMQGMSIGLDFVWIANGEIVGITPNAPPDPWESDRRYESPVPADQVLEVAAGSAAANGLAPGQTVTVDR